MPYTRNTRIKVTHKKYARSCVAQVEYRYPLTNITVWEDFEDTSTSVLKCLFTEGSGASTPLQAYNECCWNEELTEVKGMDWAKAVIDHYHKLLDEMDYKDTVEYIKYPDEEEK